MTNAPVKPLDPKSQAAHERTLKALRKQIKLGAEQQQRELLQRSTRARQRSGR